MTLYDPKMISTKRGPVVVGGYSGTYTYRKEMYLLSCKEANIPSACRWKELPHKLEVGRDNIVLIPLLDSWIKEKGICSQGNFNVIIIFLSKLVVPQKVRKVR